MSDKITSLIDKQTSQVTSPKTDVWSEFRQIERITIQLTQSYKYSLGKYSRFFIELENKRFMATKCPDCAKVYAPARPLCPDCLQVTDWLELSGEGTVKTFSVLHFSPDSNDDVRALETPYILAYVLLDGADTLFPHLLKVAPDSAKLGMRVKVQYVDTPVQHPIHLMYFTNLETL